MKDFRIESYYLMESPIQPALVTIAYLALVLKIVPFFMRKKSPFELKAVMVLYNSSQIVINTYYVLMGLHIYTASNILCAYTDISGSPDLPYAVTGHYHYLMIKILDFVETIIFVLRKKDNQVSFLHVFHHVGVFLIGWICCKFSPGGQGFLGALINCSVHIIMYSYYMISLWLDGRKIWWKNYVTVIQIGFPHLNTISFLCTITSPDFYIIITLHHKFVLLKLIDFLETDKQVSFLHVFHHTGVFLMAWISFKYSPGGANCLSAFINCIVHTVMYFYYLQSTWTKEKFQWWKKYITVLQVVANSIILLNYVVHLVNPFCSFPKWILIFSLSLGM
ncbi:very long chain fatty acid elongase F-like [Zophobas morio]|uniref:very long chain fatty acid elongase F-like n=1 Tax=Zophobas morio TaxID=2755281 RepID=UPI003082F63C